MTSAPTIPHVFNSVEIGQRASDGYLNATAACQAAGKQFNDYTRLDTTKAFLEALSLETGIPVSKLATTIKGRGDRVAQGTWVHPHVAINLGQWLSPQFAVAVSKWVFDWMSGKAPPAFTPPLNGRLTLSQKISTACYAAGLYARQTGGGEENHAAYDAALEWAFTQLNARDAGTCRKGAGRRTAAPDLPFPPEDWGIGEFFAQCVANAPGSAVQARIAYNAYARWRRDRGESPATETRFGRAIARFARRQMRGGVNFWVDCQLRDPIAA